jgi:hypothetical protein
MVQSFSKAPYTFPIQLGTASNMDFLRGKMPDEGELEYQQQVALGSAYCEHTATANADASPNVQLCPCKPGGIEPPDDEPEDPEDPPTTHNFRSCGMPTRATPRASSRFRDNSEVWQCWWDCCCQYIVNKIDTKVGMTPLMGLLQSTFAMSNCLLR